MMRNKTELKAVIIQAGDCGILKLNHKKGMLTPRNKTISDVEAEKSTMWNYRYKY